MEILYFMLASILVFGLGSLYGVITFDKIMNKKKITVEKNKNKDLFY